ncbi:MAG: anthranilate synthase component I family protein, partial [Planctomycetaceae bacterium]
DVFGALEAFADCPGVLLLESALRREPVGRYSFLMADPSRFVTIERPQFGDDPFREVRRGLHEFIVDPIEELPPFQGGAAGLLSYELGGAWEAVPRPAFDEFRFPALAVGLYDWVIAWDHAARRAWIISQGFPETDPRRRRERAEARLLFVRRRLRVERREARAESRAGAKAHGPRPVGSFDLSSLSSMEGLTSNFSREGYLAAVRRTIEYIHAGDIFQANLSQRLLAPARCGPVELYRRLRERNPAPFAGFFAHDDWAIVSASPERFLHVRDREVETRPIKGTRRRGSGPEADLFTRDELRESGKDQAENVMIVDLLRNDLSRVCAPGSIRVPRLLAVETYETVQHLVSQIRGTLADGRDAWDLFAAAFPGGSISGA